MPVLKYVQITGWKKCRSRHFSNKYNIQVLELLIFINGVEYKYKYYNIDFQNASWNSLQILYLINIHV